MTPAKLDAQRERRERDEWERRRIIQRCQHDQGSLARALREYTNALRSRQRYIAYRVDMCRYRAAICFPPSPTSRLESTSSADGCSLFNDSEGDEDTGDDTPDTMVESA